MHLLIVTICSDFGTQENKICHCFHFFPICLPWRDVTDALILVFWMLSFKPVFSLSSFTLIKGLYYISMYRDIYNYGYIPYMYIHTCICIGRDLLLVLSLSRTWTNTLCDRPEPVFWFFFFNFFFFWGRPEPLCRTIPGGAIHPEPWIRCTWPLTEPSWQHSGGATLFIPILKIRKLRVQRVWQPVSQTQGLKPSL